MPPGLIYRYAWTALPVLAVLSACRPTEDNTLPLTTIAQPTLAPAEAELPADAASSLYIEGDLVRLDAPVIVELGKASAGDRWSLRRDREVGESGPLIVAVFDDVMTRLFTTRIYRTTQADLLIRADASRLLLGISAREADHAGPFRIIAGSLAPDAVPAPQPQVVWLNFDGGQDVQIGSQPAESFGPLAAETLGAEYTGATAALRDAITAAVRENFAAYRVEVLRSDAHGRPSLPHSVIHFGGYHENLFGNADHVDQLNQHRSDAAIVYVETFADYTTMQLDTPQMGRMIGNVASHELGHLLGLEHTDDPDHLMHPGSDAWDLVRLRTLTRAPLDPHVFPVGYEDAAARLAETVGRRPGAAVQRGRDDTSQLRERRRDLPPVPLRHRCGCGPDS